MSYAKNSKTYTKSGNSKVRILNPDRLNNGANPTYDDVYTIDKADALLSAQSDSAASSLALKADKTLSNVTGILSSAHGGTGADATSVLSGTTKVIPWWSPAGIQGYYALTTSIKNNDSYLPTSNAVYSALQSYLPLAGGTLTGTLTGTSATLTGALSVSGNVTSGGVVYGNTFAGHNYRFNHDLGSYNSNLQNQTVTGAIVIHLPHSWTSTMLTAEVVVYDYTEGLGGSKILVSGYNYARTGYVGWYSHSYSVIGSFNKAVRLGHDGTHCCVILGDVDSVWSYPQVFLSNIYTGFQNGVDQYASASSITVETDISGYTNIVSPSKALFQGSVSGNAATATALTTSAGSAANPIYFSAGKPVASGYSFTNYLPLVGGTLTGLLTGTSVKLTTGLQNSSGNAISLPSSAGTLALTSDVSTTAANYLPLAGGTMTGPINYAGTTTSSTSILTLNGAGTSIIQAVNNVNIDVNRTGKMALLLWSYLNYPKAGMRNADGTVEYDHITVNNKVTKELLATNGDVSTSITGSSDTLPTDSAVKTYVDNRPIYLTIGNSTKNTTLANIGTAGTLSFTLADIGASAANSLHFMGTNGSTVPTVGSASGGSVQKGDMWKQTAALSVDVANSADGAAFNAKTGDTLIAETSSTFWLVPSGDDVEDSWRAVQVNSSALLGTGLSTGALNFASGNMTTAVGSGQTVKFNHNAIANTDLTAASRTYVNSLTFDDYGHVTAYTTGKETVVDTNTYHSAWAWTNGTTAGPTASITGSASAIAVAAIPAATASISGVVTTGAQTFAGVKTFNSTISGNISGNAGGSAASLTTNAGSAAVPVYFTGGVPVAITSYSGNAATATNATNDANGKAIASTYLPLAGGTMTGTISHNVGAGSDSNVLFGSISANDYYRFRISGGSASNNGSIALETADDGNEPISVAQYTGIFVHEIRRAYLLDASGNTSFPGSVSGSSFSGAGTGLTGTASGLSIGGTAAKATADANGSDITSTYLKLSGGTMTGILVGTSVKLTTGLQNSSGNAIALPSSAGTLALQSAVDSEASARASAITSEASSRSSGDASTLSSAKSYTDAQITNLGSILEYKGSCAYASLPASPSTGDVWNVTDANGTYPAGTNYAWNGSAWDPLGGQFDTSNLVTLNTAQTISSNKTISASNTFTVGGSVIAASTKTIYGSSTATTDLSGRKVVFENGALFVGSAESAGLATRGICGFSNEASPVKGGLFLNYDGTNTYNTNRAIVLQAGEKGTVYDSSTGLSKYAAVRGDMLAAFPKSVSISNLGIMSQTTASGTASTSEVGAVYLSESHAGVTRPASADALANLVNSTMRIDLATSSMSTSKPAEDGFIMTFNWDTGAAVNSQFYIPNHINGTAQFARLSVRSRANEQNSGNWYSWRQIPYYDEVLPLSGGTMTGDITLASGKHVIPAVSNSSNLGSTSSRFANIYVNNINGTTISAFATDSEVSSVQTALQANIDNSYPDLIDLTV